MADCCLSPAIEIDARMCPACRQRGVPVELQTVKALLTEHALRRIQHTHYRFCGNPGCRTVYFGDAGDRFETRELRVLVWQKEPEGARLFCYCFGEDEATIRAELMEHGRSEVDHRIRAHIAAHRCACEMRNPRGACCLSDVIRAVERMEAAMLAAKEE